MKRQLQLLAAVLLTAFGLLLALPSVSYAAYTDTSSDEVMTRESYNVLVSNVPGSMGTTVPSTKMATPGDLVTFTLQPDQGCGYNPDAIRVTDIDKNLLPISNIGEDTWQFTMPSSDVSIDVYYSKAYEVQVDEDGHYIAHVNPNPAVGGQYVTVTVIPEDGYQITSVAITGFEAVSYGKKTGENTWKCLVPDGGWARLMVGTEPVDTFQVVDNTHGSGCGSTDYSVTKASAGEVVSVYPKPNDGCGFNPDELRVTDAEDNQIPIKQVRKDEWQFTMPDSDVSVYIYYEKAYEILINEGKHFTASVDPDLAVGGTTVLVTVTPENGYEVASIIATGFEAVIYPAKTGDNTWQFIMPSQGTVNVQIGVKPKGYSIDSKNMDNVRFFIPETANVGEVVSFTAVARAGYRLENMKLITNGGKAVAIKKSPDGSYSFIMPDDNVTLTFFTVADALTFSDVNRGDWFVDAITWAIENKAMEGYDGTDRFGPNNDLTRSQLAQILYKMAGKPVADSTIAGQFSDCKPGQWYSQAVSWAVKQGIFSGYDGTTLFGPHDTITREQFAVVLWRTAGEPKVQGSLSNFDDGASTSFWAQEAMVWAVNEGLISGYDGSGLLDPNGALTRAQGATILMRRNSHA